MGVRRGEKEHLPPLKIDIKGPKISRHPEISRLTLVN